MAATVMKNRDFYSSATPQEIRKACREGSFTFPTCGFAPGKVQANLVVLPQEYAFDFLLFCQRNPKSCPLIEVLEPGCSTCEEVALGCDIRTDLPRYCVYENGILVEEVDNIKSRWRGDLVSFIIGCSFSFEEELISRNISMRHIEENSNVPMFNTSLACRSAGCFRGNLVVSMRPLCALDAIKATAVTNNYPKVHGAPVHIGDPSSIGITDLQKPDYGDAVSIREGELPVFWACGVTPQAVVMTSRPSLCITHAPGYMLILDMKNKDLAN